MLEGKNKIEHNPGGVLRMLAKTSKVMLFLSLMFGIISGISSIVLLYVANSILHATSVTGYEIQYFVGVLLILTISGLASNIFMLRLGQNSMFKMRMLISRQILATPFQKLEEIGSSQIYTMLTGDIQSIANVAQALPAFAVSVATLIGGLAYLGWLSPAILLVTIIFVVIGVAIYQVLAKNAFRHLEKARIINDTLFNHFRAITFGAKELKLNRLRREAFIKNELESTGIAYQEYYTRGLTRFAFASQWGQLLFFIVIGLLIFIRPTSAEFDNTILVGSVLTVIYLMSPLGVILNEIPLFAMASVAVKKIDSLQLNLATNSTTVASLPPVASEKQFTAIKLEGVTYSYTCESIDKFKLGPVDLVLRPYEIVFLIGGNGSGKSTLLKMLTGLYMPETGSVRVNEKVLVTEDDREEHRQLFSVVFADFHLFETLPHENIRNAEELLIKYLELLELNEKVSVIEGRFSTILLSQGQRKRLALLCAYLEDRPIYVFDEWAADQDPLFKEIFYSQILPDLKQRGKAILLATHDDRYFHLADRIVKLESGMLVS
jgi:putative ATP-binding cassette transporter